MCEKLTGGETKDDKRNKSLETKFPKGVLLLNPFRLASSFIVF